MNLPILIQPSDSGFGYRGTLGAPFHGSVDAATPDDVEAKLVDIVRQQLRSGGQLRWISLSASESGVIRGPVQPGWLPDDDLTREWLEIIAENRAREDAVERQRIEDEDRARQAS